MVAASKMDPSNSHPLVSCLRAGCMRPVGHLRSDSVWLLCLGHKRHCNFPLHLKVARSRGSYLPCLQDTWHPSGEPTWKGTKAPVTSQHVRDTRENEPPQRWILEPRSSLRVMQPSLTSGWHLERPWARTASLKDKNHHHLSCESLGFGMIRYSTRDNWYTLSQRFNEWSSEYFNINYLWNWSGVKPPRKGLSDPVPVLGFLPAISSTLFSVIYRRQLDTFPAKNRYFYQRHQQSCRRRGRLSKEL